jgi:acyl-CoA synthetase (AMP-forming)/AMP-acid ligase II
VADGMVSWLRYDTDLLVADLARRHARRWPDRDREAVVAGGSRLTWRQLDERVTRLTDALARRGVRPGDRVAIYLRNGTEYFEIVLALAAIGAPVVPVSFRSTAVELVAALDASGVRLLLAGHDPDMRDRVVAAAGLRAAPTDVVSLGPEYAQLIAGGRGSEAVPRPSEDEPVWFALTGGTTGAPKLVRVPHRVLVQMWLFMAVELGIGRDDVMLLPGPLYHGLGFGFALQQLYVGGRVVVMPSFDPAEALRLIEAESVTVLPAVPTMLTMMLAAPELPASDTSSLRLILSSGSSLLTPTKERLLAAFPHARLFESYGATEAGFFTVLRPEDQFRKVRSCGLPFFGSDVRVLDSAGGDAAPGEVGLVYKRGLIEGGGYAEDEQATAAMFRDGWCTAGDLGYLDDEGYLYLVDRARDMIVTGGVNVFPAEIEEVIAAVPGVHEVAVIGVPEETWGESIKAFVVPAPGARVTADQIIGACAERLASFKKPRLVEFVTELPKSAAGKVLKRELRQDGWQQRSAGASSAAAKE